MKSFKILSLGLLLVFGLSNAQQASVLMRGKEVKTFAKLPHINVEAPILLNLNPDNMIKLNFENINGVFKVYKFDMTINNYGGSGQGTKIVCKAE